VTTGTSTTVTFQDVSFAFPNGYRFAGLRIAPLRAPENAVTLDELTVRTPLLGLVLGRPSSATLSGRGFGGSLSGEVDQRGARSALHLDLEGIDLTRALAPLLPPPDGSAARATSASTSPATDAPPRAPRAASPSPCARSRCRAWSCAASPSPISPFPI
jgi:hypothetical protein